MNKEIKLVATGSMLPKNHLDNIQLEQMVETSDEWIRTRTGIEKRWICSDEESCESLAIEAAKRAVLQAAKADANFSKEQIGAVFVATSSSEYHLPSIACMIQKELELPQHVISFDLCAACSGFVFGVTTAAAFMETYGTKYILVVGSEGLSKITDYTDRSTCILFGDGAGAGIFTLQETDQKPFYGKSWSNGDIDVLGCRTDGKIYMDGQGVYKFAVKAVVQAIDESLAEGELTLEDIDYVVCHQANARIIEHIKRKYKGHEHKFYSNIASFGNTSAASIPLALDEMSQKGLFQKGMRVLCVGFGGGLTWGSTLFTL